MILHETYDGRGVDLCLFRVRPCSGSNMTMGDRPLSRAVQIVATRTGCWLWLCLCRYRWEAFKQNTKNWSTSKKNVWVVGGLTQNVPLSLGGTYQKAEQPAGYLTYTAPRARSEPRYKMAITP